MCMIVQGQQMTHSVNVFTDGDHRVWPVVHLHACILTTAISRETTESRLLHVACNS